MTAGRSRSRSWANSKATGRRGETDCEADEKRVRAGRKRGHSAQPAQQKFLSANLVAICFCLNTLLKELAAHTHTHTYTNLMLIKPAHILYRQTSVPVCVCVCLPDCPNCLRPRKKTHKRNNKNLIK